MIKSVSRTIVFLFSLLVGCGAFIPLAAQEPAYLHYTIDEGLPSNEVYDTYEDSLGYIWFATDHGISCFDGYSFRNYSTSDGLTHNTVFGFHKDSRGRMWMRAFNSTLCYMENGAIKPYAHNDKLQAFLGREFIQCFAFDKAGNLFFTSVRPNMGLFRQDVKTGAIERVKLPKKYNAFVRELDSGEFIAGMDFDNGDSPAKGAEDSLVFADHTWLFSLVKSDIIFSHLLVRCCKRGENAYLFIYDNQVVTFANGHRISLTKLPQLANNCYTENNEDWICTKGFMRFGPGTSSSPLLLPNDYGTSMLADRMGNYWFTTISEGVYLARNMQLSLLDRLAGKNTGELLDLSICGNRLIGLNAEGTIFRFGISPGNGIDTSRSDTWPENFLSQNLLYANTERNFMVLPDAFYDGGEKWTMRNTYASVSGVRGYALTGDSLLIAGNQGWVITALTGKELYSSFQNGFSHFCTAIAVSPSHAIWIGTVDGLYFFDGKTTRPYAPGNPLFRQRVTDIGFGKNGELIVSTRGSGIIIVEGSKVYNIRATNGLSTDQCGNLCIDDTTLWVCTNNGLNRIVMQRGAGGLLFKCKCIGTDHGLPSLMVNDAVRCGNFLFLATGKGLAWFDARQFHFNALTPPVYISSFLINNRRADPAASPLTWRDNNISIGFISLLYRSPGAVNYRYRLEGYESAWNYTTERMAHYFNLPPGQYRFAVSARNENGVWNDRAATIDFYIPAHFTQTAWFRLLVILIVAGAASGIVFLFVKQRHDRTKAVMALSLAEQKALRSQMKPHFIFNSLNSIQNFIINRDEDSAQIYLTSFAQLMRRVLEQSRTGLITLDEEVETLGLYLELEKLRFGDLLDFKIILQPGILSSKLLIPPLLIQPFVENALWHGLQLQKNSPTLQIRFTLENDRLIVEVEDNGIGRKRSMEIQAKQQRKSTGMQNVEERIRLVNANSREKISMTILDLTGADDKPAGTRIVLNFPAIRKEEM